VVLVCVYIAGKHSFTLILHSHTLPLSYHLHRKKGNSLRSDDWIERVCQLKESCHSRQRTPFSSRTLSPCPVFLYSSPDWDAKTRYPLGRKNGRTTKMHLMNAWKKGWIKVKQSCYMPKTRMEEEEVYLLLIHDIGTRGGRAVSNKPRPRLSPGERTHGTHCTGGWVGPRAGLDTEVRGKILSPLSGIEPRSPGRPVRSQSL
jgi:hypothetical protein